MIQNKKASGQMIPEAFGLVVFRLILLLRAETPSL